MYYYNYNFFKKFSILYQKKLRAPYQDKIIPIDPWHSV